MVDYEAWAKRCLIDFGQITEKTRIRVLSLETHETSYEWGYIRVWEYPPRKRNPAIEWWLAVNLIHMSIWLDKSKRNELGKSEKAYIAYEKKKRGW